MPKYKEIISLIKPKSILTWTMKLKKIIIINLKSRVLWTLKIIMFYLR